MSQGLSRGGLAKPSAASMGQRCDTGFHREESMPFVNIRLVRGNHRRRSRPARSRRSARRSPRRSTSATGLADDDVWIVFEEVDARDWYIGPTDGRDPAEEEMNVEIRDPRFRAVVGDDVALETSRHRLRVHRGADLASLRASPDLQRHARRPHAPLVGGGRHRHLPQAVQHDQRQHLRPQRTDALLRARDQPGHPHRPRRQRSPCSPRTTRARS